MRKAIALGLAIPGAVVGAWFCTLAAAFAGDASPTSGAQRAWLAWGLVGGGCLGATPGLLVGAACRMKGVIPFLGGAVGALPGMLEACGVHVFRPLAAGRPINVAGYGGFICTMLGLGAGLLVWLALAAKGADTPPSS
jgi:hypothetical protein